MPQILVREDIIGHRLVRIALVSGQMDGWLDYVSMWFELDNGVSFSLPQADDRFEASGIPADAVTLKGKALHGIVGGLVSRVVCVREEDSDFETAFLEIGGDDWLTVDFVAPEGTGGAGLSIEARADYASELVRDFWANK